MGKKRSPPAYHVGFTQYASGRVFRGYSPPVILRPRKAEAPGADLDMFSILDCVQYTLAVKRCQDYDRVIT